MFVFLRCKKTAFSNKFDIIKTLIINKIQETSITRSGNIDLAVRNESKKTITRSGYTDLMMQINRQKSIIKSRQPDLMIQRTFLCL